MSSYLVTAPGLAPSGLPVLCALDALPGWPQGPGPALPSPASCSPSSLTSVPQEACEGEGIAGPIASKCFLLITALLDAQLRGFYCIHSHAALTTTSFRTFRYPKKQPPPREVIPFPFPQPLATKNPLPVSVD